MSMPLLYFRERFASCNREDFPRCIRRADSLAESLLPSPPGCLRIPPRTTPQPQRSLPGPAVRSRLGFGVFFRGTSTSGAAHIKLEGRCVCVGWGGRWWCKLTALKFATGQQRAKRDFVIFRTKGRAGCPRALLLCGLQKKGGGGGNK